MATKNTPAVQAAKPAPKAAQAKHVASNAAIANVAAKVVRRPKAETKVCRVCGLTKPLTDFRAKASRPDGRDTICAEDARLWLANRKAVLAKQAKPAPKAKVAAKPAAKPATKVAAKPVAKKVVAPSMPAREAAARAKDAAPKRTTTAK